MTRRSNLACLMAAALMAAGPAAAQTAPAPVQPTVKPGVSGVLDQFKDHPLVALNDAHGLAQELDFYAAVVRDPRFAKEVGVLVVETGTAQHQAILDRYVNGEDVPYAELRQVWTDPVGWTPAMTILGFVNLFAQVRSTNMALPADQRIKVWLGDPPIDWSKIKMKEDLGPIMAKRDTFPAEVVTREVVGKGRKALIIYGGAHLIRGRLPTPRPALPGTEAATRRFITSVIEGRVEEDLLTAQTAAVVRAQLDETNKLFASMGKLKSITFAEGVPGNRDAYDVAFDKGSFRVTIGLDAAGKIASAGLRDGAYVALSLIDGIEKASPVKVYVVAPYTGFRDATCAKPFEAEIAAWPTPALAAPIIGSTIGKTFGPGGCGGQSAQAGSDALLWLGPADRLVASPAIPDLYTDAAYRREIIRRNVLRGNTPPAAIPDMTVYPATPRPFR